MLVRHGPPARRAGTSPATTDPAAMVQDAAPRRRAAGTGAGGERGDAAPAASPDDSDGAGARGATQTAARIWSRWGHDRRATYPGRSGTRERGDGLHGPRRARVDGLGQAAGCRRHGAGHHQSDLWAGAAPRAGDWTDPPGPGLSCPCFAPSSLEAALRRDTRTCARAPEVYEEYSHAARRGARRCTSRTAPAFLDQPFHRKSPQVGRQPIRVSTSPRFQVGTLPARGHPAPARRYALHAAANGRRRGLLPGTGPARAGRPAPGRGAAQPRRPCPTRPAAARAGCHLQAGGTAALHHLRRRRGAGPAAGSAAGPPCAAPAAPEPRGRLSPRAEPPDGAARGWGWALSRCAE